MWFYGQPAICCNKIGQILPLSGHLEIEAAPVACLQVQDRHLKKNETVIRCIQQVSVFENGDPVLHHWLSTTVFCILQSDL